MSELPKTNVPKGSSILETGGINITGSYVVIGRRWHPSKEWSDYVVEKKWQSLIPR
jgi:hypothetical protein